MALWIQNKRDFRTVNHPAGCWLGLVLVLLSYQARAQKRWSLQECLQYACENNLQVQQAGLAQEKSVLRLKAARSVYLPVVDARIRTAGNWGFIIDPSTNDLDSRFNFGNQASLNLSLDVFNGFTLVHQLKLRNQEVNVATFEHQIVSNTVSLAVIYSYLQVLLVQEQLKTAQERSRSLQHQHRKQKALIEKGLSSKRDLLSLQSLIASEDLLVSYAQNNFEQESARLTQVLGLPPGQPIALDTVFMPELGPDQQQTLDEVLAEALASQPDLKAAQAGLQASYHQWQIERAATLPTVTLTAQMGTRTSNFKSESFINQLGVNMNRQVGLSLYIPILNRFTLRTNEQVAKLDVESSRLIYQQIGQQLREKVINAYLEHGAAVRKHQALRIQYTAFEEEHRYAERTFELGGLDAVEYSVIRSRWVTAHSELLQAQFACFFKQKVLDLYRGRLLSF
ncbi:TolC family protein [Larkinella insperata]|uniref:TolC family protein n=1 Tax=Larkinella insperata TaxID=332158 RepID=A0ABW3QDU3_9BACT